MLTHDHSNNTRGTPTHLIRRLLPLIILLQLFLWFPAARAENNPSRSYAYPSAGGAIYFEFDTAAGTFGIDLQYYSSVFMKLSVFQENGQLVASNSTYVDIGPGCSMRVYSTRLTITNYDWANLWIKCEVTGGSVSNPNCYFALKVTGTDVYLSFGDTTPFWAANFFAQYWWIFVIVGGAAVVIALVMVRSRHARAHREVTQQPTIGETQSPVSTVVTPEQVPPAVSPDRPRVKKISSTRSTPVDDIAAYLLEGLTLTPAKKEEEKKH